MDYILAIGLLLLITANVTTTARECYVCGLGARNPFKSDERQAAANAIVIPTCNEFERSDNIDGYVVTCPENYAGCITQTDGLDVTRTCEMYALSDCQTANGVKYCYCNTDRCNGLDRFVNVPVGEAARGHHISDNTDIISDDEDDTEYGDDGSVEASGSDPLTTATSSSTPTLQHSLTTKDTMHSNGTTIEPPTTTAAPSLRVDENNFLTTSGPKTNFKSNTSPVTLSIVCMICTIVTIVF